MITEIISPFGHFVGFYDNPTQRIVTYVNIDHNFDISFERVDPSYAKIIFKKGDETYESIPLDVKDRQDFIDLHSKRMKELLSIKAFQDTSGAKECIVMLDGKGRADSPVLILKSTITCPRCDGEVEFEWEKEMVSFNPSDIKVITQEKVGVARLNLVFNDHETITIECYLLPGITPERIEELKVQLIGGGRATVVDGFSFSIIGL